MELHTAQILARQLMDQHGLSHIPFQFDRSKRRLGRIRWKNGICQYISLSKYITVLNEEKVIRNTILHECAHALVGYGNGHNSVWRQKAIEIGCNPKRCYLPSEIKTPISKYTVNCMKCGKNFQASRRRKNAACRSCCKQFNNGRYSNKFLVVFEEN